MLSGFLGSVAVLTSGAIVAQAFPILLTPVLTRMYLPEHFGAATLFVSIATVLSAVGSFGYQQAIPLPKEDGVALVLTALSAKIIWYLTILVAVGAVITVTAFPGLAPELGWWLLALPVAFFLTSLIQVLNNWNLRKKQFKGIAVGKIGSGLTTPTSRIGLGLLLGSSTGNLIIGALFGTLINTAILQWLFHKTRPSTASEDAKPNYRNIAKEYKDFPLFTAPTALLRSLSENLPVVLMAMFFPAAIVGFFALSRRLARMPAALFSQQVRSVFLQRSADLTSQGKPIYNFLLKSTLMNAAICILPCLALYFFGEELFALALGKQWGLAGTFAEILAPAYFCLVTAAPASAVYVVLRRQALWLRMRIILTTSIVLVFVVNNRLHGNEFNALGLYSGLLSLFNGLSIVISLRLARQGIPAKAQANHII